MIWKGVNGQRIRGDQSKERDVSVRRLRGTLETKSVLNSLSPSHVSLL
jgi:hypothetical protein